MVIRTEVKFYTVMTVLCSVARRIDLFLYFTAGIFPQRNVQKSVNCECVSLIKYFDCICLSNSVLQTDDTYPASCEPALCIFRFSYQQQRNTTVHALPPVPRIAYPRRKCRSPLETTRCDAQGPPTRSGSRA